MKRLLLLLSFGFVTFNLQATPTLSACGGYGTNATQPVLLTGSTNYAGTVTLGATTSGANPVNTCIITFDAPFSTAPSCVVTTNTLTVFPICRVVNTTSATIVFNTNAAGAVFRYVFALGTQSSGSSFPTVVAFVAQTGITGSQTYNNLPSAPTATGLYELSPYWIATTQDISTQYQFTVTWTDENGDQLYDYTGAQFAQYPTPIITNQNPIIIHPAIGTSIRGIWTVSGTGLLTVIPSAGSAGSGYSPGDTSCVVFDGSLNSGSITVLTVNGGGGVLTASVLVKGHGYAVSTGNATVPCAPVGGGDGNLQIDITALAAPTAVFSYYATLIQQN